MRESFFVKKVLNNNVLIATHNAYKEVVLIGKGIGFNKKKNDEIDADAVEKMFLLKSEEEQEQYKQLLLQVDENVIEMMNDIITHIQARVSKPLNEHIHIGLTDHIAFAVKRFQQGLNLKNPFLIETKALYPKEFEIAEEVVAMIHEKVGVQLPIGEVGFIALHIHSALTEKNILEVNQDSQLIQTIINVIEESLNLDVNKESVHYMRLIRHLHFAIDRVKTGEVIEEPKKIALLLKEEYPLCYNLSWKVIKIMQQALHLPVYEAEAVYLTMHLQRLMTKSDL
ncbi:PRD domain-containing protein [Priestia flexa]|uniref:glucose PTS transporter transcription antiterminator GlcT n=1 Tax=Priestia flexa TaxID=86664 RepID=UPI002E21CAAF|nr:PRD domain-containing protein [Priestia flexa]MED3823386.1 PRD domain-containing protein [Priestia flexa]